MNILHICSISNNKTSGISRVVPLHFIYQKKYANTAILNCSKERIDMLNGYNNVFYLNEYNNIFDLPEPFNKPDLVCFHSNYIIEFIKLYKQLIKANIPYIVIPHCCLTQEAQKIKPIKKKIGNFLFFNSFIKNSIAIQYLSLTEKENTTLYNKESIISGNGIELPKEKREKFSDNKIKMIYIGRYAIIHKGIDMLFKFVKDNIDFFIKNRITIDMYGAGNDGIEKVSQIVREKSLSKIVKVYGPVFEDEKKKLLLNSDMFIQLSRLEGQPLGIMEALAYGIPVIASDGSSFGKIVEENKCGIRYDSNKVINELSQIINNKEQLKEMSKNARLYAIKNFSWNEVAKNTIEKYKKIGEMK